MGRADYIFGQFRETARCRDVQHGDGVCCAFAPQLVAIIIFVIIIIIVMINVIVVIILASLLLYCC